MQRTINSTTKLSAIYRCVYMIYDHNPKIANAILLCIRIEI